MSLQSRILWGFGLAAVIAWAVFVVAASIAAARGVTTSGTVEHWGSLAEVQSHWISQGWAEGCTQASYDLLTVGPCNSSGWLSRQTYPPDQPLTVSGTFRGEPASSHNQYWVFTTIGRVSPNTDDDSDCRWWEMHTARLGTHGIGALVPGCYGVNFQPSDIGWHSFRMEYVPTGYRYGCVRYWLDGAYKLQYCGVTGDFLRMKVGTAAVWAGQPDNGERATGQWGPLTIVAGATATPTPTPTPTPRPRGR